jgi:arylformamidase
MILDISPPVGPASPVWPGDTAYTADVHWPRSGSSPVLVHRLSTTPHVGAHADAPSHFLAEGPSIDAVSLEAYLGPCQVLDCRPVGHLISLDRVRTALGRVPGPVAPRLLLRSYDAFPSTWVDSFPGLAPEVLDWFAGEGGLLVGVDTASLDPMRSTTMDAHRTAAAHGIAILENLRLDGVAEGRYELVALPLPLEGLDASPVRAVLRTVDS